MSSGLYHEYIHNLSNLAFYNIRNQIVLLIMDSSETW
jgi:hypothetical protein